MARNGRVAAIDADGHILERSQDIAKEKILHGNAKRFFAL